MAATATQDATQTQDFDPVGELRKRYPGVAQEPDAKVIDHLSNPDNFRAAFPEFQHLDNDTITRNMARHAPNLPGGTPQLVDAVKAGKAPGAPVQATPFEQNVTGGERGAGAAIKRAMPGLFASPDATRSELAGVPDLDKPAPKPASEWSIAERARRGWQAGGSDVRGKIGTALSYAVGPYVGMDPQAAEEKAARGDTGGIVGQAAVPAAQAVAPLAGEALKPLARPITSAVTRGASAVAKPITSIAKRVAEPYGIGVEGESLLKKGLSPYAKQLGYDKAVEAATPDIVKYHGETPIKSVKDLHEALPAIQDKIMEEEVRPVARTHAKEELAPERMARVQKAVEESVSPFTEEFDEGAAKDVKDLAAKMGKTRTLGDVIGVEAKDKGGLLGYINSKLESYFQKYPSARKSDLMKNPDTAAWEMARRQLRTEAMDHLAEQGETNMGPARERWGALQELQRTTERRINQADRTKPMSLPRIVGAVGAVKTGGASLVAGEVAHHLNKADTLVRRGIEKMARNQADKPIDITPQAPRLPAPEKPPLKTGPGGPPPSVAPENRIEPTGRAEGPTALGTRGKGGVPAPKLLPAPRETSPPAVPFKNRVEVTGRTENATALGATGEGGTIGGRKLLPAPKPPHGMTQPSPIMKPSSPSAIPFIREEARPPATPYTPKEMEEAELLVRQTHDMMTSSDKPGRYYSENQPGEYNSQKEQSAEKGVTAGGHWFGVKSMRTMLPWIKDTEFTPSQLERGMREGGNLALREKILNSAARFIRAENEKSAGTAYRAHDVGKTDVDLGAHAHATASKTEALDYAEHRNPGTPQQVSKINIGKWKPEDFEDFEGPNGKKWFKFKRQPTPEEYE